MSETFLFGNLIFGPIKSRRLGLSLGINLLPINRKLCNFDCIYCECGFTPTSSGGPFAWPTPGELETALEARLILGLESLESLDAITFAGNGEPSLHPRFGEMVDVAKLLRDRYSPLTKIAVLSNASLIDDPETFDTLLGVDENILKLDSAVEETLRLINRPGPAFRLDQVVEGLLRFKGRFVLQTMFLKAMVDGRVVDNTTPAELDAWLKVVEQTRPRQVMIYPIARATPLSNVVKVDSATLQAIGERVRQLGIEALVVP